MNPYLNMFLSINFFLDKKVTKSQGYTPRRPSNYSLAKRDKTRLAAQTKSRFTPLSQGVSPAAD